MLAPEKTKQELSAFIQPIRTTDCHEPPIQLRVEAIRFRPTLTLSHADELAARQIHGWAIAVQKTFYQHHHQGNNARVKHKRKKNSHHTNASFYSQWQLIPSGTPGTNIQSRHL